MARKWKNSDDVTVFVEKAVENRLEKLRKELIIGYVDKRKFNQNKNRSRKNYQPKNKNPKIEK